MGFTSSSSQLTRWLQPTIVCVCVRIYIYIYITHTHIYANDSYNGEEGDCTSLFGQLALEIIWDVGSAT